MAVEFGRASERFRFVLEQCQFKFPQLSPERLRRKLKQMNMAQLKELSLKLPVANTPQKLGLAE